jgi:hypothetical protein
MTIDAIDLREVRNKIRRSANSSEPVTLSSHECRALLLRSEDLGSDYMECNSCGAVVRSPGGLMRQSGGRVTIHSVESLAEHRQTCEWARQFIEASVSRD